jgi:hypothetical protein
MHTYTQIYMHSTYIREHSSQVVLCTYMYTCIYIYTYIHSTHTYIHILKKTEYKYVPQNEDLNEDRYHGNFWNSARRFHRPSSVSIMFYAFVQHVL